MMLVEEPPAGTIIHKLQPTQADEYLHQIIFGGIGSQGDMDLGAHPGYQPDFVSFGRILTSKPPNGSFCDVRASEGLILLGALAGVSLMEFPGSNPLLQALGIPIAD